MLVPLLFFYKLATALHVPVPKDPSFKLAPRRVNKWDRIEDGALMNLRKLNTHYTLVAQFKNIYITYNEE